VIAARRVQTVDQFRWERPIIYGPDQTFPTPPLAPPTVAVRTPPEAASYTLGETITAKLFVRGGSRRESRFLQWAGRKRRGDQHDQHRGARIHCDRDRHRWPGSAVTDKYTVTRLPTTLEALPQLVLFPWPHGVGLGRVSATLESVGAPVVGRLVSFSIGGTTLCAATTGVNGAASCRPSFAGEVAVLLANRYTANFSGDDSYMGLECHDAGIRARRAETSLSSSRRRITRGSWALVGFARPSYVGRRLLR